MTIDNPSSSRCCARGVYLDNGILLPGRTLLVVVKTVTYGIQAVCSAGVVEVWEDFIETPK